MTARPTSRLSPAGAGRSAAGPTRWWPATKLELVGRLCDQVMAEAPADEELCRAGSDAPYLRRWWLRRAGRGPSSRAEAVYLHEILEPDAEPPHNHPWDSANAGRWPAA